MSVKNRVRVEEMKLLSDNWATLHKATFSFLRNDGTWQRQHREVYDRGNGATILLYDTKRRTVILTKQFRFPPFHMGHDDMLIETPAGLLDNASPEDRIRAETEEETGFHVRDVRQVMEAFMSPGSVAEKVYFFVGAYSPEDRIGDGGGEAHEGEDIETIEVSFDDALAMIADGRIMDGKTIMLLHYAALHIFKA